VTKPKIITAKVGYSSTYEFEGSLKDVAERIQELIKEHGPEAWLDYNPHYYYDYDNEPSPRYEIYIKREETDDEVKLRRLTEAEEKRKRDEREKKEFERLAKKYGTK
jgi:hypothetical protein